MAQAKLKPLPRPYDRMLTERLEKAKPEDRPVKLLELRMVELLLRSGMRYSEANRTAEQLVVVPQDLAEQLHKIANEYLHTLATPAPETPRCPGDMRGPCVLRSGHDCPHVVVSK